MHRLVAKKVCLYNVVEGAKIYIYLIHLKSVLLRDQCEYWCQPHMSSHYKVLSF